MNPMFDDPPEAEFIDRVLDALFPNGSPPHSGDCADHDHCVTCVLCEDVWDNTDPAFHDRVHPFVVHWLTRRHAERN